MKLAQIMCFAATLLPIYKYISRNQVSKLSQFPLITRHFVLRIYVLLLTITIDSFYKKHNLSNCLNYATVQCTKALQRLHSDACNENVKYVYT